MLKLEVDNPLANRLSDNRGCCHCDQDPFKSGGEKSDPLVTLEEMKGSGLCAQTKTEARNAHSDHVRACATLRDLAQGLAIPKSALT
jgi:hypothetical protein